MADEDPVADARAYIEALAHHDVSHVRLAQNCRRVENRIPTGRTGPGIVADLATGRKYRVIRRVDIQDLTLAADAVHARFRVHVVFGLAAPVRERFDLDDAGRIRRITATIGWPRPA